MKKSMVQNADYSFAIIPGILLWIANAFHSLFTFWAISVGGTKIEMAALFPIVFIEIPSVLPLIISVICMLIMRKNKRFLLKNIIPAVLYILQVAVFWAFLIYK